MRPNSALILDHDGIVLLQRSRDDWRVIGQADPHGDDLAGQMQNLRRTAVGLSYGQFATKLIIPNSQILFRTFELEASTDEASIRQNIRVLLDGLTPYDVDDLAFDWTRISDGQVQVAAVAEETLREAEDFALSHRFNPVSFAAIPEPSDFSTEPFFGQTASAHKLLNPGGKVEPDTVLIDLNRLLDTFDQPKDHDAGEADQADKPEPKSPSFTTRRETGGDHIAPMQLKWVAPRLSPEKLYPSTSAPSPGRRLAASGAGDVTPVLPVPLYGNEGATATLPTPAASPRAEELRAANLTAPATIPPIVAPQKVTEISPRRSLNRIGLFVGGGFAAAIVLASGAYLLFGDVLSPPKEQNLVETEPAGTAVLSEESTVEPAAVVAISPEPLAPVAPTVEDFGDQLAALDPSLPAQPETGLPDVGAIEIEPGSGLPNATLKVAPQAPAAPGPDRADTLYVTSIDRAVINFDAVALINLVPEQSDLPFGSPGLPPPPGAEFTFDERGLVIPSPDGTLTPEGVLVYAGPPPVRALPRPGSQINELAGPLTAEEYARLAAILPTPRPQGLGVATERAQLAGLTRSELAAIRPVPRPAVLSAAQEELVDTTPTERAVVASRRPLPRPSGLDRAVEAAVAAASRATAPASPPAVAPQIPSGASVAQAATVSGLRLNRLNVIGIYRSSNSRRALVRLPTGRFVMVSVGDRLDGGRVVGISDESLVYSKGGRNITLTVPTG